MHHQGILLRRRIIVRPDTQRLETATSIQGLRRLIGGPYLQIEIRHGPRARALKQNIEEAPPTPLPAVLGGDGQVPHLPLRTDPPGDGVAPDLFLGVEQDPEVHIVPAEEAFEGGPTPRGREYSPLDALDPGQILPTSGSNDHAGKRHGRPFSRRHDR
jgi:hypothetical protein